jgi:hypothetical protein
MEDGATRSEQDRLEKLHEREREKELHAAGLLRVPAYVANLLVIQGIDVVRGPKIQAAKRDQGLFVPAWAEWLMCRRPKTLEHDQRERLESVKDVAADPRKQYLLLIEAHVSGGTMYDPLGDVATEAALRILEEQHGKEIHDGQTEGTVL